MTQRMNKPFVVLLVIAVAIGVGIGGVFAGGVSLGKSSGDATPTALSLGGPTANSTGGTGQGRFRSGPDGQVQPGSPQRPAGQADRTAPGPQSQDQTSGDATVQSFPGRGGVSGTVDRVEGNVVTITTTEGPVEVTLAEATAISQISEASVDDLQPGIRVRVMGPTGEDGRVEAANLVITPEGLESSFGRGQRGGQGVRRGDDAP